MEITKDDLSQGQPGTEVKETALISAIFDAYNTPGDLTLANHVYRFFLSHTVLLPVEAQDSPDIEQAKPLFMIDNDEYFLPVFSSQEAFLRWAKEDASNIHCLHLKGSDVVRGLLDNVYLCLDIGEPHYKQFNPEEVQRMFEMLAKVESILKKNTKKTTTSE